MPHSKHFLCILVSFSFVVRFKHDIFANYAGRYMISLSSKQLLSLKLILIDLVHSKCSQLTSISFLSRFIWTISPPKKWHIHSKTILNIDDIDLCFSIPPSITIFLVWVLQSLFSNIYNAPFKALQIDLFHECSQNSSKNNNNGGRGVNLREHCNWFYSVNMRDPEKVSSRFKKWTTSLCFLSTCKFEECK